MLKWFRRPARQPEPAREERAASDPVRDVTERPAPQAAGETQQQRNKRRRGTRGGRNRNKRPSDATATTSTAKADAKPARTPASKPAAQRKPAGARQRTPRRRTPAKRPPLPAAKRELLVSVDVGEQRVAVLEDDRVAEVYLERPGRRSIAGNIYKGSVDNVLPGMEAAFVARRLRLARWAPKPFEQAKTPYVTRALPPRGARCVN